MSAPTILAPLDDVQSDAAEAEDHDIGARFHLGRVDDRAHTRGHAAADVANLVERGIVSNLGERDLRQHRVVGEGGAAHVVEELVTVERKAAAAVGHEPLALGDTDRLAEVGLGVEAVLAGAALRRVKGDHMIALLETGDPRPAVDHDAGAFVSENGREEAFRIAA